MSAFKINIKEKKNDRREKAEEEKCAGKRELTKNAKISLVL